MYVQSFFVKAFTTQLYIVHFSNASFKNSPDHKGYFNHKPHSLTTQAALDLVMLYAVC